MIATLLALLAAASNAFASVLQRRAARTVPAAHAFRLRLFLDLLRTPAWLGGIGALLGAFLLQAAALSQAGLTLIQPVLSAELPFTMILLGLLPPRDLARVPWRSVGLLTAGLVGLLAAAAPREGSRSPGAWSWVLAGAACAGGVALLVLAALVARGAARGVLIGIASSVVFAFTAALMKEVTELFGDGITAVVTSWELYGMVVGGLAALFLLQNALQSGTLVAVQPALTVSDPVASILLGIGLFGERIRTGPWVALEVLGVALILAGSIGLSRSPMLQEHHDVKPAKPPRSPRRSAR
ncbi:DMT family transporter [Actinomadura atramentaria]|uniref:DMT family transporter n=1 Tax=Actinomadura atramentaria TaxID=1990 RepID=UPI00036AD896|nr:DMT family transporter [Actinomadura atramentaria]